MLRERKVFGGRMVWIEYQTLLTGRGLHFCQHGVEAASATAAICRRSQATLISR
jgi:hypothetical protein